MSQRMFLLKPLVSALVSLGLSTAVAAPFSIPFSPLPPSASGNNGDTSEYFDIPGRDPYLFGCTNSVIRSGRCRDSEFNYDTRYQYDSLRWRVSNGASYAFLSSINWRTDNYVAPFRTMYFGYDFQADAPGKVVPGSNQSVNYSLYSNPGASRSQQTFQLTTESIFLHEVSLSLIRDGFPAIDLFFDGDNKTISLSNASLLPRGAKIQVAPGGTFRINALAGQNRIERFERSTTIDTPTAIAISPGAWLTFADFGDLQFRGNNTLDAVGLNQDGGPAIQRGNFRFDGQANFSQGAALNLLSSETSATFEDMTLSSGATLSLSNGSTLAGHIIKLSGSSTRIGEAATLTARAILVNGDNRIDFLNAAVRSGNLQITNLGIADAARLEVNGRSDFKIKGTTLIGYGFGPPGGGGLFHVTNRSSVTAYDNVDIYSGSTLSLADQAIFNLRPDTGSHEVPSAVLRGDSSVGAGLGNPGQIHVGLTASLNVVFGGQIEIGDRLNVKIDNTGDLSIRGNLRGSGQIEGDGAVFLLSEARLGSQTVSGGWLYPGIATQPIATLATDTALVFEQGS